MDRDQENTATPRPQGASPPPPRSGRARHPPRLLLAAAASHARGPTPRLGGGRPALRDLTVTAPRRSSRGTHPGRAGPCPASLLGRGPLSQPRAPRRPRRGFGECVGEAGAGPRPPQHPGRDPPRLPSPSPGRRPLAPASLLAHLLGRAGGGGGGRVRPSAPGGWLRTESCGRRASASGDPARLRWRRQTARRCPRRGAGPAGEGRAPRLSFMQRGRGEGPGCPGSPRPPR